MNQTDPRAVANLLVGSHYECEDPWYSCPLSVEGCADETKPKECECGHDKRVEAIAQALADAERRGLERAAKVVEQMKIQTCAIRNETAITQAHAAGRREGLEEAAKMCEAEALIDDERGYYGKEMANAIRAKAAQ